MVEQATPQRSLVRKLAQVMGEIDRLPKRGHNSFHNYDYVLESDIVELLRGKLAERNVFVFQSMEDERREGTLTIIRMRYTFADADSGETYEVKWVGQGEDKGDKGAYKAATGALKYLLLKHFMIPTGDDPENDSSEYGKNASNGQRGRKEPRRDSKGINPQTGHKNASQPKLEGQNSRPVSKTRGQSAVEHGTDPKPVADRQMISLAYNYGKDKLGLSVEELKDLVAEVRNGLRSTEGMTQAEVAHWRQCMEDFAKHRFTAAM